MYTFSTVKVSLNLCKNVMFKCAYMPRNRHILRANNDGVRSRISKQFSAIFTSISTAYPYVRVFPGFDVAADPIRVSRIRKRDKISAALPRDSTASNLRRRRITK